MRAVRVVLQDRDVTTIAAVRPAQLATVSGRDRRVLAAKTIEEDRRFAQRETASTLAHLRLGITTTPDAQGRRDPYVMADPPVQPAHDQTGEKMASEDRDQDHHQEGRRVRATNITATGDAVQPVLSGVTMTGDLRGQGPLRVNIGATDHPAHRVVVRIQPGQVDSGVDLEDRVEGRMRSRGGHLVDRGRDRAGQHSVHDVTTRQVEQEVVVSDRRMTIAIDGPAAAGKSTVGEIVARKIDGIYFDTGLLYRALTLLALEHDIAPSDAPALTELASSMDIQIGRPTIDDGRQVDVRLNGRDVTHLLRTPAIDRSVSAVSAHADARLALLEQQRRIGRSGRVVMVGRDIGTVVLPDAELKIYLDASAEERARRRCMQLEEAARPQSYEDVLADMIRRDRLDSERDVAPLVPAADAIVIDSDRLTIEEVADIIVAHALQRLGAVCG